ncbi:MAG: helix-turn-helix transcriptional regulator [Lachnospiraceae bacterium]|nr:helix-turn-helix transcriptional regulator [Lachnospiraceae bacterium]
MIVDNENEFTDRKLFTPSIFAKENILHPIETGFVRSKKAHATRHNEIPALLFYIVDEGEGELRYDDMSYELKKGDCVFLNCNRSFQMIASENGCSLTWIYFSSSNIGIIYEEYENEGGKPAFTPKNTDPYAFIIKYVNENGDSTMFSDELDVSARLAGLIAYISREGSQFDIDKRSSKSSVIRSIASYIENHHSEKLSLDRLSDMFYMNKFSLSRYFSEELGISLSDFILRVRINHAKRLLRFTDKDFETIARECGFKDSAYFSRKFRQAEGVSPSSYKKMW